MEQACVASVTCPVPSGAVSQPGCQLIRLLGSLSWTPALVSVQSLVSISPWLSLEKKVTLTLWSSLAKTGLYSPPQWQCCCLSAWPCYTFSALGWRVDVCLRLSLHVSLNPISCLCWRRGDFPLLVPVFLLLGSQKLWKGILLLCPSCPRARTHTET